MPALNPDFALIHVQRCDPYGNAQIDGLPFMDLDLALAANRVILTTERIVSNDQIRRRPDQTKIPFFAVDAVVEVPFGCAPHECYGVYEPLFSHLDQYAAALKPDAEQGIRDYLDHYFSSRDPGRTISTASVSRNCSTPPVAEPASMTTDTLPYTAGELLAVMSAGLLRDGQIVFAGVGIPLLAATLAQRLHGPGLTILFEGGTIGAYVEPGQLPPSTNEQRCTRRANMVLGSTDVLLLLQRGYVDIGFMGGAQIDQYGNLNSSFIGSRSGRRPAYPAAAAATTSPA